MRRSSGGRLRYVAVAVVTTVMLGAQSTALAAAPAAERPAPSTSEDAARPPELRVVPGSPGLSQPPTVVYTEGFENATGQIPILLTTYTGAPPVNAKYTADPPWVTAARCNGIILNQSGANQPACQNQNATAMAELKYMANVLGRVNGTATPSANHAVSAYTDGANPGANLVEFQTVNPIPLPTTDRFLTFAVDVAAVNCNVSGPQLQFFLTGSGPDIPVTTSPINPCTDPRAQTYDVGPRPIEAGVFASDASVLFSGASVGIKMTNGNGSGQGNDHAYDTIKILDVTPQLDKAFVPASITEGSTSTVTFTVTNTTELAAKNGFGFTDTLPAGVTVAATPNAATTCGSGTVDASAGGSTIGLTDGSLAAGEASCTITVDVTSTTPGLYVNEPSDLTPTGVNPPGPATLRVTVPGAPTIAKAAAESTFTPGQTIHYTYTVTNPSDQPLNDVTVTDNGPGTPTVTCPATTLAAGASFECTATYTATQSDATAGIVANTATVTGTDQAGTELTGASNRVVVPLRAITVTKAAEQTQFSSAGQTITYTFTVTNNGRVPLSGVAVTDIGPGNPPVTCPVTDIAPGATISCAASYTTTAADVQAGQVEDSATATGTTEEGDTATDDSNTVTVPYVPAPEADLAVVKTGPATVAPGGQVSYTITVTNNGPQDSTGWELTDTVPAGLTNVTTSTPGCGIGGGVLTCSGGALANGDSVTIQVTGTVAPGATTVTNTAEVTGNEDDPDPDNNTSTTTTDVEALEADLAVVKSGPASVAAGGQLTYTITVSNNGPDDSSGWKVTDSIPAGLANVTTSTPGCGVGAGVLTCTGGALANGDSVTIQVTGTVAADATGITNTAEVTGNEPDPDPDNNTSTTTTEVEAKQADLAVVKTGPASVSVGDRLTYTITVSNNGPDDSSGWKVIDSIPAGLANVTTSTPGCGIGGGVLTCTGGALANGDSVTIQVTGIVAAGTTGITNTVLVTGNEPDPDPDNNTSTTTTPVDSVEIVKKRTGSATVRPGDTVSYTITVKNTGGAPTEASFTDDLSELLDDADYDGNASASTGVVDYQAPNLSWEGELAVGETATITFSVTVHDRPFGDLQLDNTVVSETPGNNCPAGGTDPQCTTHDEVTVKDKDKRRA
ncbi:hypothetical protein [Streptomyces sp. NPDC002490]|uniref:DUF7507 domain-containing protein n=1 Tax=Streptomyces sp. NPDC002490 TaxID=3154416 RepID=UPI00331807DE